MSIDYSNKVRSLTQRLDHSTPESEGPTNSDAETSRDGGASQPPGETVLELVQPEIRPIVVPGHMLTDAATHLLRPDLQESQEDDGRSAD